MGNEIEVKKVGIVSLIEKESLGNIIKPLMNEIHLFDSYVSGTARLEDKSALSSIAVGDELTLQREINKFDDNAIVLFTRDRKRLGYVPEKDNIIFARLMDAGKLLKSKIISIERRGSLTQIQIGIYLVDF